MHLYLVKVLASKTNLRVYSQAFQKNKKNIFCTQSRVKETLIGN